MESWWIYGGDWLHLRVVSSDEGGPQERVGQGGAAGGPHGGDGSGECDVTEGIIVVGLGRDTPGGTAGIRLDKYKRLTVGIDLVVQLGIIVDFSMVDNLGPKE